MHVGQNNGLASATCPEILEACKSNLKMQSDEIRCKKFHFREQNYWIKKEHHKFSSDRLYLFIFFSKQVQVFQLKMNQNAF